MIDGLKVGRVFKRTTGGEWRIVKIDRVAETLTHEGTTPRSGLSRRELPMSALAPLFLDGTLFWWNDGDPIEQIAQKSSGLFCTRCGEFYEYAVANQKDGTLKCWSCRSGS
jgi:hypothetical protein